MKADELRKKLRAYAYIVIALLLMLLVRLAVVQLFNNETYQTQAKDNMIRLLSIKAPRGEIYARDGEVLAANELVYSLSLTYLGVSKQETVIDNLLVLLKDYYPEISRETIEEKVEVQKFRLFEPVTLIRDIPWELVVKLEENRQEMPGIAIVVEPLRYYPQGPLAGHTLGYIHSINPDEMEETADVEYSINSLIGKSGIEKHYESVLKGKDGARSVEVDAQGRPIREQVTLVPEQGSNIYLTLDKELQQVLQKSMENTLIELQKEHPKAKVGSAVVLNVKTGEVLAICSSPSMYPDDWKGNISSERAEYYFPQTNGYDPMQPGGMVNRAIQATYPPGSTFKMITGMAAQEKDVSDPLNDYVNCTGSYWIAPHIRCWSVHGNVNYYSALAGSCNVYFQEMGRRAGYEELIRVASEMGLGTKTGIDVPYELSGLLPTPEWKKEINALLTDRSYDKQREKLTEKYNVLIENASDEEEIYSLERQQENERARLEAQYEIDYNWNTQWQPYDTFNMSMGQGFNDYTVIQLANYVSTIANGGYRMKPYLVSQIASPDGEVIENIKPQVIREVDIKPASISETKRAMLAVTEPGGTAHFLFSDFPEEIKVGAKTGSAETGRSGDDPLTEVHGVFVAFAPFDNPEIAFAGVVEYGYSGGSSAGLVARDVFQQYFGIKDHLVEENVIVANAGSNNAGE